MSAAPESTQTSDEFAVLHALRVRGFANNDALAESTGLAPEAVAQTVTQTNAQGLTRTREGRVSGTTLTSAGRARHADIIRGTLDASATDSVASAYRSFLAPNADFKQVATDAQMGTPEQQATVSARLAQINDQVQTILVAVESAVPRFGLYRDRLSAALARYDAGDASALARPMSGSYHDVWMEIHEDFLATLDQERTEHDG